MWLGRTTLSLQNPPMHEMIIYHTNFVFDIFVLLSLHCSKYWFSLLDLDSV